jgi:hypothetical protein
MLFPSCGLDLARLDARDKFCIDLWRRLCRARATLDDGTVKERLFCGLNGA